MLLQICKGITFHVVISDVTSWEKSGTEREGKGRNRVGSLLGSLDYKNEGSLHNFREFL